MAICKDTAGDNVSSNNELVVDEHDDEQLETDEVLEDAVVHESNDELDTNDCLVWLL